MYIDTYLIISLSLAIGAYLIAASFGRSMAKKILALLVLGALLPFVIILVTVAFGSLRPTVQSPFYAPGSMPNFLIAARYFNDNIWCVLTSVSVGAVVGWVGRILMSNKNPRHIN